MLQTIANIISIIAGIITILGIGGILTWSLSRKGKTQWSENVLSVFSYGIKTALCIIWGGIMLWVYLMITSMITFTSARPLNAPVLWQFYFNLAVYFVLAVFAVPIYLVLCSCIYKSSWDPWQRFLEIFYKRKRLEVIEARYYSAKHPDKYIDATEAIKKMVHKGKRRFLVNNGIVGDPEKLVGKELKVKYRLDGDEREKTATERSTMSLD